MYTGTLILDLMAAVEQAQRKSEERRITEELRAIYAMQIPVDPGDQILMGAA
jgi:hypothetical protein